MPCLEITMPKQDVAVKQRLAFALTNAFDQSTPFERDIFGIHFTEYERGGAATGGNLCLDRENSRPYLHLALYCPRMTRKAKALVVAAFTAGFVEATGNPNMKPVIHICEHPYDNVGVDGALLSDSYEACAEHEFYYPLPKD